MVFKAQSEDISEGGAKLISETPFPSQRLLLRFLLPAHWDRYLEAEVVSESVREQISFTKRRVQQYVYRVRFTGVAHTVEEMDDPARTADQDCDRE